MELPRGGPGPVAPGMVGGGRIRPAARLPPKQVRYQLRHSPARPSVGATEILTGLTGWPQGRFNGDPHDATVDDLAGPSGGTATAELEPRTSGVAHATPPTPQTPVSPSSRARERVGPVRRMLLASTAGRVAGAVIASGALVLTDRSSGSSFPPQAKPIVDKPRGGQ